MKKILNRTSVFVSVLSVPDRTKFDVGAEQSTTFFNLVDREIERS